MVSSSNVFFLVENPFGVTLPVAIGLGILVKPPLLNLVALYNLPKMQFYETCNL